MRKTKIVCTLGPAVSTPEMITALMQAGMNVARFNFSHADHVGHKKMFDIVDEIRNRLKLPVATLLDTKGPEIRTGVLAAGKIELKAGDTIILTTKELEGDASIVSISHKDLYKDVRIGTRILIDDGLIELSVEKIQGEEIHCQIINGGPLSNRKGINVPGIDLSMPYISEKDREDILFGIRTGFDYIAASFVTCAEDVLEIRKILGDNNCTTIKVIAKIESAKGVANIDEILRVADGIMVARGDLGVEIPTEEVPIVQKALIKKSLEHSKSVITATQMLDSMTNRPRPTRAEAGDVANAIYDGTSAVMLSGETANGLYPIEAVKTMATIAERTERDINYWRRLKDMDSPALPDITYAIAHATCTTAHDIKATAIISITQSGYTARMASSFRPGVKIIGCTPLISTYRHLGLSWGVEPVLMTHPITSSDELFEYSVNACRDAGMVSDGDLVVLSAGVPIGIPGTSNILKVHVVGDVIATGQGVGRGSVVAKLCVAKDEQQAKDRFRPGDILVIPKTSNAIMSLLRSACGIITEEPGLSSHAAVVGLTLDIPVIVGSANATLLLKNGVTAQIDAVRGVVCNSSTMRSCR